MTEKFESMGKDFIKEVIAVAGREAAKAILKQYGGCWFHVPSAMAAPKSDGALVNIVGADLAEEICDAFLSGGAGLQIDLPVYAGVFKEDTLIVRVAVCTAKGMSANETARELKTTSRHVFRLRAALIGRRGPVLPHEWLTIAVKELIYCDVPDAEIIQMLNTTERFVAEVRERFKNRRISC